MKRILAIFVCLFLLTVTKATNTIKTDSLPTVFALGQYDGQPFEKLKAECETQLLTVCRNDMQMAYYLWVHMLKHLETHATKSKFDMDGIKLWLYVFWNKDGSIKNIAFYPKPNSKNFKNEDMIALLSGFSKTYKFPMTGDNSFSHYSTANFPVMVEKPTEANNNTNNNRKQD
ncbi:MAG: hypothetical protein JNL70_05730 [Saprospiraceae bacterium]|nr:hypothetical protein [Saprospiraceae bacterium]